MSAAKTPRRSIAIGCPAALGLALAMILPAPAFALSEIQDESAPQQQPAQSVDPVQRVPLPSTTTPDAAEGEAPASDEELQAPADSEPSEDTPARANPLPNADPAEPVPDVVYDLSTLPEPTRRMHGLILEAAKSGDIERLRPLLGTGETSTQLSLTGLEADAITFLKNLSGDAEGHEILAILDEVLEAGFVHIDAGTEEEMYVWPYFFAVPLDSLNPRQRVEMFRIVTAGDYEEMKNYGAYIFYRVGITPQGRWSFFVAGE